jgi:signal transduction histidine kinase
MKRICVILTILFGLMFLASSRIKIAISDNGIGFPEANLIRIFNGGFTTRKEGHGFGLHSGALAAKEMGGALTLPREGNGKGASFPLALPLQPPKTIS